LPLDAAWYSFLSYFGDRGLDSTWRLACMTWSMNSCTLSCFWNCPHIEHRSRVGDDRSCLLVGGARSAAPPARTLCPAWRERWRMHQHRRCRKGGQELAVFAQNFLTFSTIDSTAFLRRDVDGAVRARAAGPDAQRRRNAANSVDAVDFIVTFRDALR